MQQSDSLWQTCHPDVHDGFDMKNLEFIDARAVLDRTFDRVKAAGPRVSAADLRGKADNAIWLHGSDREGLATRGVAIEGRTDCIVIVPPEISSLGAIKIFNLGVGNVVFLAHNVRARAFSVNLRMQGNRSAAMFAGESSAPITLPMISMRSDEQIFYWGLGATSVSSRVEIEGAGCGVLVGDDCMFSSGIWVRNHDMHTVFDTDSLEWLNPVKADVVIEQHVWLSFEAAIVSSVRVGFGAILGARALLTRDLREQTLAVGVPAKVIRQNVSWCRSDHGAQPTTIQRLERLRLLALLAPEGTE